MQLLYETLITADEALALQYKAVRLSMYLRSTCTLGMLRASTCAHQVLIQHYEGALWDPPQCRTLLSEGAIAIGREGHHNIEARSFLGMVHWDQQNTSQKQATRDTKR